MGSPVVRPHGQLLSSHLFGRRTHSHTRAADTRAASPAAGVGREQLCRCPQFSRKMTHSHRSQPEHGGAPDRRNEGPLLSGLRSRVRRPAWSSGARCGALYLPRSSVRHDHLVHWPGRLWDKTVKRPGKLSNGSAECAQHSQPTGLTTRAGHARNSSCINHLTWLQTIVLRRGSELLARRS